LNAGGNSYFSEAEGEIEEGDEVGNVQNATSGTKIKSFLANADNTAKRSFSAYLANKTKGKFTPGIPAGYESSESESELILADDDGLVEKAKQRWSTVRDIE